MAATRTRQQTRPRHLERRGERFFRRRRWPRPRVRGGLYPFAEASLVFSLPTQGPCDATILARRLTQTSDRVFAALAEMTTMAVSTERARTILAPARALRD